MDRAVTPMRELPEKERQAPLASGFFFGGAS